MDRQKEKWNSLYSSSHVVATDDWLDTFKPYFENTSVLDLGCGDGGNLEFLMRNAKRVEAGDYSTSAIEKLKVVFGTSGKVLDMRDPLPFPDKFFDMVLSDLSLHYFSLSQTGRILQEIDRVLKERALMLIRVNSTRDVKHGFGKGIETERNFFEHDGYKKRFFDREMIEDVFTSRFEIVLCEEKTSFKYENEKWLWEILLRKLA